MQLVESNPFLQEFSTRTEVHFMYKKLMHLSCKCEINMVER